MNFGYEHGVDAKNEGILPYAQVNNVWHKPAVTQEAGAFLERTLISREDITLVSCASIATAFKLQPRTKEKH